MRMSVLITTHNSTNNDKLPLVVIPSSPKQQKLTMANGNTYKTNQKFSDYYPMFTPPIVTNGTPVTAVAPDHHHHHHHQISRSNSAASLRSVSTMQPQHPPHPAAQTILHSQRLPVKANIRDSQWIKENVLRNLQTRKPFAAAQSILNSNSNNTNSAGTTTGESSIASNSLGSTTSNYNLITTPSSTVKPASNEYLSSIRTPPSTIKLHPSIIAHSNNRSSDTGATVKKVEFVDINDQQQNNQSNMNSFQRLCELASKWNSKNRLVATQVIKLREKKYLSSSIAVMNENSQNVKIKPKPRRRRTVHNKENLVVVEDADYVSVPATTSTTSNRANNNNNNTNNKQRYSKIIGKNFIQLRPANEVDAFTNIHYAFSNDADKTPTASTVRKHPREKVVEMPPLQAMPTMHSMDTAITTDTEATAKNTLGESTVSTNNTIKWINSKSLNLSINHQPLHVT